MATAGKPKPVSVVDQIREDVAPLGGSVGEIRSTAKWVELHGPFTPDQLRRLAKAVEKKFIDRG